MSRCNTNKDFLDFAKGMGYQKKRVREFLRLQRDFVEACVARGEDVVMTGLVSFKIRKTSSTLHPGLSFFKAAAVPSERILELSKRKGSRSTK